MCSFHLWLCSVSFVEFYVIHVLTSQYLRGQAVREVLTVLCNLNGKACGLDHHVHTAERLLTSLSQVDEHCGTMVSPEYSPMVKYWQTSLRMKNCYRT